MRQTSLIAFLSLIAAPAAFSQTTSPKPEFEVASVRLWVPGVSGHAVTGGPGTSDPERLSIQGYALESLILDAYNIQTYQIIGPDWLSNFGPLGVKVDIEARVPPGTAKEQFRLMLQNLLAERFGLTLHHEQKEMRVYDLAVAKNGPKFAPSSKVGLATGDAPQQSGAPTAPQQNALDSRGCPILAPGITRAVSQNCVSVRLTRETMAMLTDELSHQVGRPIVDATELKGEYDIRLSYVYLEDPGAEPNSGLADALQDQLGLKLESKKGSVNVLVIDHIEKAPTVN